MSLLVDWQIRALIESGEIIISPFNEAHLNTVSYDVTIGPWVIRERKIKHLLNPLSEESIQRRWCDPEWAPAAWKVIDKHVLEEERIEPNSSVILLEPGELVLAHTNEAVGGVTCVTTAMHARSTLGRMGVTVCKCAGWGDVGYFSPWTMEVQNHSSAPIAIPVNSRVAQISFELVEKPKGRYTKTGHYQIHTDPREAMKHWVATKMFPKPL